MPNMTNTGTRDIPLKFAKQLTHIVNKEWEDGTFIQKVSTVTEDLLRYWFSPSFCDERTVNFHEGQKQAILNAIYCHEILKTSSTFDMYQQISDGIIDDCFLSCITKEKYSHPKYCVKMATGTGKTWVMNALFLWQYLNAKYNENKNGVQYTKNFLFVTPGLIVYERLLDSFLGKEDENGIRHFETSDLKQNEDVFIPHTYREAVYGFVQNNIVRKEEIAKKITGEGIIAITNWHLLAGVGEEPVSDDVSPLKDPTKMMNDLLPITPGVTAGHSLDTLDNQYLNGGELEYLKSLKDILVFNDEAHHIHENKTYGQTTEVEWQKSLNYISEGKTTEFIQIDFSATPYDVTGSGQTRTKHYFPHIIVDYTLNQAIRAGLVKTIAIDRRKEFASLTDEVLNFKSVRDGKNVLTLSEGQRLMIRAGLSRLKLLEKEFTKIDEKKYPKMLIMCEDTKVSPLVAEFLCMDCGLSQDDVMLIDSDKKGAVKPEEWKQIKQNLFNIDKKTSPKVVVSVMMLREGFDVSNICVIVPLRSSQAPILLEQTIGRGLRLMWREHDYDEIKWENRHKMLDLKEEPNGYYDILHIVEHPAFLQFYEDLNKNIIYEDKGEPKDKESVLGDIITVGLKEDYGKYDFYIPSIIKDREEILSPRELSSNNFEKSHWTLEQLQKMIKDKKDETFFAQEMTVQTRFGEYRVTADIFNAQSYNDFLTRLLFAITNNIARITSHAKREFPVIQVHQGSLVALIDNYIRNDLFYGSFNPMEGNNWRILMLCEGGVIQHILKQVSKAIYELQTNVNIDEAEIRKTYFSSVPKLKMRENFSLNISKSIYEKTGYPSNKGEFERDFLLFSDTDSHVKRLLKINENWHCFASLRYIRTDGMLSSYFPDFLVQVDNDIFFIETKAQKDISQENVIQKQKGALDWIRKINELMPEDRMHSIWRYAILDDNTFYLLKNKGASLMDMLKFCELTNQKVNGTLL